MCIKVSNISIDLYIFLKQEIVLNTYDMRKFMKYKEDEDKKESYKRL